MFCVRQPGRRAAAAALVILCACFGATGQVHGQARQASLAIDANTGEVLHAQSADELRYPASLTKMMTLYLAFREIEAGRLRADTRIPVSAAAASVAPSKLGLDADSDIALSDAMKALVTKSANDMAVAIAERIAGSEAAFAKMMTQRARQIGMTRTVFRNASGLPDPEQVTTARDMLTLALRIHDEYPQHYRMFSLKYFTYRGETHRNHNTLLFHFAGTEGMKTGYTRASGFNLVTSVKREGKHIVAAVFGGQTAGSRNAHMRGILSRALAKASTVKTRKPAPMLIAQPKPAPRPSKPAVAVNVSVKAPAAPARPAAVPPTAAAVPPAAVALPATGAPSVEIALVKVRPSPVAAPEPRPVAIAAAATAGLGRELAASPASERAPEPTSPPAATETIISKAGAAGRQPGTLDQQMALLLAGPAPAVRPATAQPAARAIPTPPSPTRGAQPSTLNAQAARLGTIDEPRHLGGPGVSSGRSGYSVIIGSYASADEAEARLAMVQSKSLAVAGQPSLATPVVDGGRTVYRAAFSGFDAPRASAACLDLRRSDIDCFVSGGP